MTLPEDLSKIRDELQPRDLHFRKECANDYSCGAGKSWQEGFNAAAEIFLKREAELERALRIESAEPIERTQEAAHYNWLDDQNEKLQARNDKLVGALTKIQYQSTPDLVSTIVMEALAADKEQG